MLLFVVVEAHQIKLSAIQVLLAFLEDHILDQGGPSQQQEYKGEKDRIQWICLQEHASYWVLQSIHGSIASKLGSKQCIIIDSMSNKSKDASNQSPTFRENSWEPK